MKPDSHRNYAATVSIGFVAVVSVLLLTIIGCGDESPTQLTYSGELLIHNWEDYFAPDTLKNFEEEFGVAVQLTTFDSEDTMLAALQSDPSMYDLVIASGATIETLRSLRLLAPINTENIPNLKDLEPRFHGLYYDPEDRFSVPYLWGTTGLAINSRFVDYEHASWNLLWEAEYAPHSALLDDPQEAFSMALMLLDFSGNSSETDQLEAAGQKLRELQALGIRYPDHIDVIEAMISGELWIAQMYNGDALLAAEDNPDIVYSIPQEGTLIWIDNFVVPSDAKNGRNAEAFINYILRPEVIRDISEYVYFANPNRLAQELLDPDFLADPRIHPPPDILARSEFYEARSEAANQTINRIWAELRRER